MRHTVYLLVEPTANAMREFPLSDGQDADLLLERQLMSREYGDRSPWRKEEVSLVVKLVYLARMREYDPFSNDLDAKRIFGSDAISIQVFDRWWTLREVDFECPSEQMSDYLAAVAMKIQPTGNTVVDEWLNQLNSPKAS